MASVSSRTLQVRLLILVLLAFIPAIGFFQYANGKLRNLQVLTHEQDLLQRAADLATEYQTILGQNRALLATLAEFPEIRNGQAPACNNYLERVIHHFEGLTTISLIGLDGYLACGAVLPASSLFLGDRLYYQRATSRRDFAVGEFALGRISGLPVVGVGLPIIEGDEIQAVLASSVDLNLLARRISATNLPHGYTLTILDRDGRVMVRLPRTGDFTLADTVGAIVGEDFPSAPESRTAALVEGVDMDGIARLFAVAPLRGSIGTPQGYLAFGRTKATLMEEVDYVVDRELRLLAAGAVALLALAWILGHFWVARSPEP